MSEAASLSVGDAELRNLFPPEIEFEGKDGKVSLEYEQIRYGHQIHLRAPADDVDVVIGDRDNVNPGKIVSLVRDSEPDFVNYLQLLTELPENIRWDVLSATGDIPDESLSMLSTLRELYQEDYKWLGNSLWLVTGKDELFAVEPKGTRKAGIVAATLSLSPGRNSLRSIALNSFELKHVDDSVYSLPSVPFSEIEKAAEGLEERDHEAIAEAMRSAGSYKSQGDSRKYYKKIRNGMSEKELEELKEKAEGVRKRRERETRYKELYGEFEEQRYKLLADKNELLLYPKCVASFGVDFSFQKVASDDLEYHIASRINNGRWPPSVKFKPKDEFFPGEVRKLRDSIKQAVNDLPESPANQLRTYAVDWILSENV